MSWKSLVRYLLLFPIQPPVFRVGIAILRHAGLLPQRSEKISSPRKILVVNLTPNVGDGMMMMPTLDSLHRLFPEALVDLVIEGPMAEALAAAPTIQKTFRFSSKKTHLPLVGHYFRVVSILKFVRTRLMKQTYDLAILPRWGTDPGLSTYLAAASSASQLWGHDPREEVGTEEVFPGMTCLTTCVSKGGHGMPEAVREQLVLNNCGFSLSFNPDDEAQKPVPSIIQMSMSIDSDECLRRLGIDSERPFALFAPGASHPARCWPPAQFAELARELNKWGLPVYSLGSDSDVRLGDEIAELSNYVVRNIAGRTSILESLAVIREAAILVTNDSGPAHMGGSLGTSTLVLSMSPTTSLDEHVNSPLRVRPVGPRVAVLQPNKNAPGCHGRCDSATAHCIKELTLDEVVTAARLLLGSSYKSVS